MNLLNNERGAVKQLIYIVITIVMVYVGYKFAMPYYRYESLKSECSEIARLALNRQKTLEEVYLKASELNIPIDREEIDVAYDKKSEMVTIRTSWIETVNLLGLYETDLEFNIDITK
ncbi:MAG: hypothetical protein L3V56_12660 [Candidatus Magnetoovum sp. WYHC-5]|nr:hypothetical protein [Candidatus Magnetoovum sp. WYHC-5]